jgi:hypothetical protein
LTETEDRKVLDWLLEEDEPAARYATLLCLLDRRPTDPEVVEARSAITKRGWVRQILAEQRPDGHWQPEEEGLYTPKYLATNWRMLALSDLGVTGLEPGVSRGVALYVDEWLKDDRVLQRDREVCVLGNFARAMTRFGYGDDPRVRRIFEWLVGDQKEDGGWHCFPGKTAGTLDCWEALAAYAALPRSSWSRRMKRSAELGAEFYLDRSLFREGSRRYAPWFRFHYPVHYYYDLLVGLDVVTSLGYAGDERLAPALRILEGKRRPDGAWNLDAVHQDLGPGAGYRTRKQPTPFVIERAGERSKWVTLTSLRVLKRVREAKP